MEAVLIWLGSLALVFFTLFVLGAARDSDNKFPKDKGYGIENDNIR
jgi:hypothetical protein